MGSLHFSQSRHPKTYAAFRSVVQYTPYEPGHLYLRNHFLDWSAEGSEVTDKKHRITFDIDHVLDIALIRAHEARQI